MEEFFESFEDTVGLANDGAGMSAQEKLTVLVQCLRGAREKTYRVIHRANRANGKVTEAPEEVYDLVKQRLMRFVETDFER